MAYKFTEKQDCRQQQTAYVLYMMGASCFQKSVCNTRRLETTLHLYYQDMPANRQEKLEEKVIADIEKNLQEYLPIPVAIRRTWQNGSDYSNYDVFLLVRHLLL